MLLLPACAGPSSLTGPASPQARQTGRPEEADQPVAGTVRAAYFQGTLQAVHPGSRQVTILLDDGKVLVKVGVGKGAGDLAALQRGSRVSFTLRESVRITENRFFHPETGRIVQRHPPGSSDERELTNAYFGRRPTGHHDLHWVETIDVPAKVVGVDPSTRTVRLITYDGRHFTVNVSNPRANLDGLDTGEPVVAHFTEVDELSTAE